MERFIILIGITLLILPASAYLPGTLEDGLVGYWRMENDASDYLGANNGTLTGSPTYTASGHLGGAYSFDGVDDYIDISGATSTLNALSGGSISMWFKFDDSDTTKFKPLIYLGTDGQSIGDSVIVEVGHPYIDPVNDLYLTITPATSDPIWCFDSNSGLSAGQWYHFVAAVNSSGNTGYLNGVEMTTRSYNFGTSASTEFFDDVTDADLFTVGYGMYVVDLQFYYFNGTIDEVGVWNRTLSSSEVSDLYSMTTSTTTTSTSTTSTTTTSTSTSTTTSTLSASATCSSCEECSSKLDGTYETVYLTTDLLDQTDTCIQVGSGDVEFDCQGHTIDGDEDEGSGMAGINIADSFAIWDVNVRNCVITDCWYGIRLLNAFSCEITGNTLTSNNNSGIRTEDSFYNTLENNTATANQYGLLVTGANHPNYIRGNTVNSNTWIGIYFWDADYTRVNENEACYNAENDFWMKNSEETSGTNNTCNTPYGWNDTNITGCTYACSVVTTTTTSTSTSTSIEGCLKGDSDCSGTVSDFELLSYIDAWVSGQVTDFDLLEAIDNWSG